MHQLRQSREEGNYQQTQQYRLRYDHSPSKGNNYSSPDLGSDRHGAKIKTDGPKQPKNNQRSHQEQ